MYSVQFDLNHFQQGGVSHDYYEAFMGLASRDMDLRYKMDLMEVIIYCDVI